MIMANINIKICILYLLLLYVVDSLKISSNMKCSRSSLHSTSIYDIFNVFTNKPSISKEISRCKTELLDEVKQTQPNGLSATSKQRQDIKTLVSNLERYNPTSNPALSSLMNGFWRLEYTDFSPPATSTGKLGPFVGDVYQDLDSTQNKITNILDISFPTVRGGLVAKQAIYDKNTWFVSVAIITTCFIV